MKQMGENIKTCVKLIPPKKVFSENIHTEDLLCYPHTNKPRISNTMTVNQRIDIREVKQNSKQLNSR